MIRPIVILGAIWTISLPVWSQINWGLMNQGPSPAQSFFQGQRDAAELERVRQETERLRIENEQRRRQLEESRRRSELQAQQEAVRKQNDDEVIKKWIAAAQPRMHLYVDFREIVFAPDVRLTLPMIQIMSESRYAADIAYFLGGDKKTALQISLMEPPAARAEMSRIEGLIRDKELLEAHEEIRKLRAALAQVDTAKKEINPLASSQQKP